MFKKAMAFILSAVIMAGASTAAFAESAPQTITVEQEYGASAAKTWDGKSAMKAGQKYVLKKSVTIKTDVVIPKGATLTLNKGVKLTIGAKGDFEVKGKLAIKSGATLVVTGELETYKGSTVSNSGTIKLTKNKADVTIGGKFTINKGGKITGVPEEIELEDSAKVTVKGTNSCKKLQTLLKGAANDVKADTAEIEKLLNTYVRKALKGDVYGAVTEVMPEDYLKMVDAEIQKQYGVTLEEFLNTYLVEMLKAYGVDTDELAKQADSVSVKVTKLTDCLKDLTADQKAILSGCGKITKAYVAEIGANIDGAAENIPGLLVNDGAEATVAYAGGKWYIVG